jgi:hypothetical protein
VAHCFFKGVDGVAQQTLWAWLQHSSSVTSDLACLRPNGSESDLEPNKGEKCDLRGPAALLFTGTMVGVGPGNAPDIDGFEGKQHLRDEPVSGCL